MREPLKQDLADALDSVSELVDQALNPSLTREELVEQVRLIGDAAEVVEPEPEDDVEGEDLEEPEEEEE